MYEIYEVPNNELDNTEEFVEEFTERDLAFKYIKDNVSGHRNLWVILANDAGYYKVVAT